MPLDPCQPADLFSTYPIPDFSYPTRDMSSPIYFRDTSLVRDVESGYASASSSESSIPDVYFSKPHLKFLNQQLQQLEPERKFRYMYYDTWQLLIIP